MANYRWTVLGYGYFPVDMLRVNQCLPANATASEQIEDSHNEMSFDQPHRVDLESEHHSPHVKQWEDHGWRVVESTRIGKVDPSSVGRYNRREWQESPDRSQEEEETL